MARRHGRRIVDPDAPVVDLDRVLADDLQIDLIGQQHWPDAVPADAPRSPGAHRAVGRHHRASANEPLFELLDEWRLELAGRPLPDLPLGPPPAPSRTTPARHRRRSWRPMMAVAAAIGAVLVGTVTVGAANADPRSPLWPITQMIWPARAQSIESTQQIQVALDEARVAMAAGRSGDAQRAIIRAAGELDNIDDAVVRDSMRTTVNQLWAKTGPPVASRTAWGGAAPSRAAVVTGPAEPTRGPAAQAGPVAADPVGSTPVGPAGTTAVGLTAPAGQSGSADTVPSESGPAPTASAVPPVSAASTPSTTPTTPAAPATVPDPAAVVEPPASSPSASSSSPPVATQQSAPTPTPTQTTPSASDTGSPTARGLPATEGGGAQPAADESPTSSTAGPTSSG